MRGNVCVYTLTMVAVDGQLHKLVWLLLSPFFLICFSSFFLALNVRRVGFEKGTKLISWEPKKEPDSLALFLVVEKPKQTFKRKKNSQKIYFPYLLYLYILCTVLLTCCLTNDMTEL